MDKGALILAQLKANPFITQQQLADKVNLSRSAVANYIADLTKQGKIKGRAYIFPSDNVITCIGGANLDRKATAHEPIRYHSSNPVTISETFGGVARNVAENLSQMNHQISFLSIVGNDKEGKSILEDTKRKGIDVSLTEISSIGRTGTYTALLDLNGEMAISLADMDIYDQFIPPMIEAKWSQMVISQGIFMDTNLPSETLACVIKKCRQDHVPLYIDPVSSLKAKKLPQDLTGVDVLFPNLEEAEELSGITINAPKDYLKAAEAIRIRGVKNVIITLGSEGVFYASSSCNHHLKPYKVNVVDVTGAGDALTAGVLSSLIRKDNLETACRYGMAAAALALCSKQSVAQNLNFEYLTTFIKENTSL